MQYEYPLSIKCATWDLHLRIIDIAGLVLTTAGILTVWVFFYIW